ncbi:MAG: hypothetical protein U0998_03290 [Moraxellaceae bacterium]|nr:hypothetical protein [Moraxellaceae bacterium]MDZ4386227.1 hypothetical protein [Moraxellaceae bacterium]
MLLRLPVLMVCLSLSSTAISADTVSFSGDVRLGYFSSERDDRDGSKSDQDDARIRLRAGLGWQISDSFFAKARLATRYSSAGNKSQFKFFHSIPLNDGLAFGDTGLDELYLRYQPNKIWSVAIGRLQTKAELEGVAKKSLSRNDSPNTDISWTDGVQLQHSRAGWISQLIVQANRDEGATTVRRSPLAFTEERSHLSYYAAIEKKQKQGLWLQRGVDFTYLPKSLRQDGNIDGRIKDYAAVSTRLSMQWPLANGMRWVWANELGYAANTPSNATLRLADSGNSDGGAWQTSINLMEIAEKHGIALVYGRIGGGWLLSPDFGNNQELIELRYQWRLSDSQSIEARLRQREDLAERTDANQKRNDIDSYLRYTLRF